MFTYILGTGSGLRLRNRLNFSKAKASALTSSIKPFEQQLRHLESIGSHHFTIISNPIVGIMPYELPSDGLHDFFRA